jgi:hypothetical protein
MHIKNTGDTERAISRDGVNIPLMPGASVELPLSEEEAKAFRGIGFTVWGQPTAPSSPVQAERRGKAE